MKPIINRGDVDYHKAINYRHSYYNFPVTVDYGDKKFILRCGSADIISTKMDGNDLIIVSENSGLNYISMTVIDLDKDSVHEVFLSGNDLDLEDSYSYGLLDKDLDEQIKIMYEYIS